MVYKNNSYSNDETVSVLYDVHNFLEIRFLQLFSIFHKMKKHEVRRGSRILKWGVNFCNNVIEPKPG